MSHNQFPSVHNDDIRVVGVAANKSAEYIRISLIEIDHEKVAAREHALLLESIAGSTRHDQAQYERAKAVGA